MTAHLHMQFPTSQMTDYDYETVLCHLSEQIGGLIPMPHDYRADAEKEATDALANTFDDSDGLTIADWMRAAAEKCHVDPADCLGI